MWWARRCQASYPVPVTGLVNLTIMGNNFFNNFSCGLFGFDIEWQPSNSSAQSVKGNQAIWGVLYYKKVFPSKFTSDM